MRDYDNIKCLPLINEVEQERVEELKKSMLANGWTGSPILYTDLGLVTGSHRLAALKQLESMCEDEICDKCKICDILDKVEAIDVMDIINQYCEENDCSWDQIDFSSLGRVFAGTEIEEYKDEIEW